MICGLLLACLSVAGCSAPCIPALVVCTLFVACRPSSSASIPTGEAAVAVRAASVLDDGVCGFVVVCGRLRLIVVVIAVDVRYCCCCCSLWLSLCLWVVSDATVDTAL